MPGNDTSREATALAAFMAALLAPFVTGIMLDLFHGDGMPVFSGSLAFIGAIFLLPAPMFFVWAAIRIVGRLACECGRFAVPILIVCTAFIGACVALFEFDAISNLEQPGSWLLLGAFLTAGALTGAAYAGLIVFWDRLLKELATKQNGRPFGRPFA